MIEQDKWQAHYQILSITLLKESIAFNVDTDTMIKNVKLVKLKISIVTVNTNVCDVTKTININLMKS